MAHGEIDEQERETLAARLDCITRKQLCKLGGITESTEEAWRKRGKAPPYVLFGNEVLYPTQGLTGHLRSIVRSAQSGSPKDLL